MGIALLGGAVIVWVWIALLVSARAVELDTADPVNGVSRRRLVVLGFLWWPVVFISVILLSWLVVWKMDVCAGPFPDYGYEINCFVPWTLAILVSALVTATIAVVLMVMWVRGRQATARGLQQADGGSGK